jgi:hypothetical protein
MSYVGDPGIIPDPWFFHRMPPYSYSLSVQAQGYSSASVSSNIDSPRETHVPSNFVVDLKRE